MGERAGRVLDWSADHVGDVYFLAMLLVVLAAVGLMAFIGLQAAF